MIPTVEPRRPTGRAAHSCNLGKLAPRLGFAWDVKGDARWKAYGSWGVFYDLTAS